MCRDKAPLMKPYRLIRLLSYLLNRLWRFSEFRQEYIYPPQHKFQTPLPQDLFRKNRRINSVIVAYGCKRFSCFIYRNRSFLRRIIFSTVTTAPSSVTAKSTGSMSKTYPSGASVSTSWYVPYVSFSGSLIFPVSSV